MANLHGFGRLADDDPEDPERRNGPSPAMPNPWSGGMGLRQKLWWLVAVCSVGLLLCSDVESVSVLPHLSHARGGRRWWRWRGRHSAARALTRPSAGVWRDDQRRLAAALPVLCAVLLPLLFGPHVRLSRLLFSSLLLCFMFLLCAVCLFVVSLFVFEKHTTKQNTQPDCVVCLVYWCTGTGVLVYVYWCTVVLVCTGFYWFVLVCTGLYWFVLVCTGLYWFVLVCTGLYWFVLVCTGLYWFVLVCTGLYWFVLVCTGLYWFVLVCTGLYWFVWFVLVCTGLYWFVRFVLVCTGLYWFVLVCTGLYWCADAEWTSANYRVDCLLCV
jgi:hypothetical protein